jgi:hypothetical protein
MINKKEAGGVSLRQCLPIRRVGQQHVILWNRIRVKVLLQSLRMKSTNTDDVQKMTLVRNLFYVDDIWKPESGEMAADAALAVKWIEYDNSAWTLSKRSGYRRKHWRNVGISNCRDVKTSETGDLWNEKYVIGHHLRVFQRGHWHQRHTENRSQIPASCSQKLLMMLLQQLLMCDFGF